MEAFSETAALDISYSSHVCILDYLYESEIALNTKIENSLVAFTLVQAPEANIERLRDLQPRTVRVGSLCRSIAIYIYFQFIHSTVVLNKTTL